MNVKTFKDTVYGCKIHFLCASTPGKLIKYAKRKGVNIDGNDTDVLGSCWHLNGDSYVWVKNENGKIDGSLLHECIHAALHAMDYAGIQITGENSEPLTYYATSLFEYFQPFTKTNQKRK